MIKIKVNGKEFEISEGTNLQTLLSLHELSEDERGIAVALNDAVVPKSLWGKTILISGSSVEIVHAVQGG